MAFPRWLPVELSTVEPQGPRKGRGDRAAEGPIALQVQDFVQQFRKIQAQPPAPLTAGDTLEARLRHERRQQQWLRSAAMRLEVLQAFVGHHRETVALRQRELERLQERRGNERNERLRPAAPFSVAASPVRAAGSDHLRQAEQRAQAALRMAKQELQKAELLLEPIQQLSELLRDNQGIWSYAPNREYAGSAPSEQGVSPRVSPQRDFLVAPPAGPMGGDTPRTPRTPGGTVLKRRSPPARCFDPDGSSPAMPLLGQGTSGSLHGFDQRHKETADEATRKEQHLLKLDRGLKESTEREQNLQHRIEFITQENARLQRQIEQLVESRREMTELAGEQQHTLGLLRRVADFLNVRGDRRSGASPWRGLTFWCLSACALLHTAATWGSSVVHWYGCWRRPFELALPSPLVFALDCVAAGVAIAAAHEWLCSAVRDAGDGGLRWLAERLEQLAGPKDAADDSPPPSPSPPPAPPRDRDPPAADHGRSPAADHGRPAPTPDQLLRPGQEPPSPAWVPLGGHDAGRLARGAAAPAAPPPDAAAGGGLLVSPLHGAQQLQVQRLADSHADGGNATPQQPRGPAWPSDVS